MKTTLILITATFMAVSGLAQDANKRIKHFNIENSVALQGYDAVAYHIQKKAIKGNKAFKIQHQGIVYWFSSQANLDLFKANPEKYEPAYGGWCAYAMGTSGDKVEVDPETFKIVQGKLHLFYNAYFNNTLKDWNKDEKRLKPIADKNWNSLFK